MKILRLLFLTIAGTLVAADGPAVVPLKGAKRLEQAYQMQVAVLQTQDIRQVGRLLDAGVDINAAVGCGTYSPLDGAVQTQNVEMLKFLLSRGAKPLERQLVAAAFASGHQQALQMVQLLLEAGVSPNARDIHGNALIRATYRENHELVSLLLSQKDIKLDETDVDGYTALMWAVKHGSLEIIHSLVCAGADLAFTNHRGETAASIARQEIEKQRAIISVLQGSADELGNFTP